MVHIRRAQSGDEETLARIQTESWKAAFAGIVPAELLAQCANGERAETMYARLLAERRGNGYILELDGKAHCIAWWDAAKDDDMPGAAELRCIHSLPDNWRRGYRQPDDGACSHGCQSGRIRNDRTLGICAQRARDPVLRSTRLYRQREKAGRPWYGGGNVRQRKEVSVD